jgi:uncharacterized protein (DUF1330 family)
MTGVKMKFDNAVYPTSDQLADLMRDPSTQPIVMLNLLKFRAAAEYEDGRKTDLTGAQAYGLYADRMRSIVERGGGRFLFVGEIKGLAIGAVEGLWDIVALVEYPSSSAFAKIATSPEVAEIGVHRAAGLEGQLLIPLSQRPL